MSRLNRRKFLKKSAAATVASSFVIAGTKSSGKVLGANDAIRIGVAGLHGRGSSHVGGFAGMEGVQVTYLIDPDATQFASRSKTVKSKGGNTPTNVKDIREALDDKNLDAISIATPNHWHSLMAIWGCQAEKDVYVEKPCSHNVFEGGKLVEAARKYNRIVQHGTQSRSTRGWAEVIELVKSGNYGELKVAKGYCYKPRGSIKTKPFTDPPAELDFNLWLGPAPDQQFHRNLVHYNWHWFWDTGNGDIGNQGVHQMDIARWGIPYAGLPKSVFSLGGRLGYEDQGETPNTQLTVFDYGSAKLLFEVRGLNSPRKVTNEFYTTEGMLTIGKFYPKGGGEAISLPKTEVNMGPGGSNHFANFISAVRSRNQSDLNAEVQEGHLSAALGHLANISYRLGEEVAFTPRTGTLGDDKVAYDALLSMEEHLSQGNGLKLSASKYRLGAHLQFNAASEKFKGNDKANAMLTRNYRTPFVVPSRV